MFVLLRDASSGGVLEELAHFSDPAHVPTEGPPANRARDVALSADGRTGYYSVGPEPACGDVMEVAASTGAVPESRGVGSYVAAGPGGHYVTSGACGLGIRKGSAVLASVEPTPGLHYGDVAWSSEGRVIAVERSDGVGPKSIVVFDLATGATSEITDPEGLGYELPAFRYDGRMVVAQPRGDGRATAVVVEPPRGGIVTTFDYGGAVVDQSYDATNIWLLVTMADGRLRWFGGGDRGDLGVDGQVSADW